MIEGQKLGGGGKTGERVRAGRKDIFTWARARVEEHETVRRRERLRDKIKYF